MRAATGPNGVKWLVRFDHIRFLWVDHPDRLTPTSGRSWSLIFTGGSPLDTSAPYHHRGYLWGETKHGKARVHNWRALGYHEVQDHLVRLAHHAPADAMERMSAYKETEVLDSVGVVRIAAQWTLDYYMANEVFPTNEEHERSGPFPPDSWLWIRCYKPPLTADDLTNESRRENGSPIVFQASITVMGRDPQEGDRELPAFFCQTHAMHNRMGSAAPQPTLWERL